MEHKLKAVIDTNLFVSGLFGNNTVSAILQDHWINLDFILMTSIDIIKEVNRVLHYPRIQQRFNPDEENIKRFFRLVFRKAVITKDRYKTDRITNDPTDNKFLACALEGRADYILSRDPHLRNLKHYQGIQIIDATTFVNKLQQTL
ncbi:MAG: putative toxin-antitoxin system toxin component, PIN family [Desulfobacteraceae bacterium]|nr:putative toxin-antitoxin system toxin component, PIN family [Desulfobacteraceae bacterium]